MFKKFLALVVMVSFGFTVLADSYANGKCCIRNNDLDKKQEVLQKAESDKELPPCHKAAATDKAIKKNSLANKDASKGKDKCCCDYKGCFTKVFINHSGKAYNIELSDIKFFGLNKALEGIHPEDNIRPPKQLA